MEQNTLRETFNSAAARYHRARPGYPEELVDDLIELTGVDSRSKFLEIGPGTGKATLPLAERGLAIHGIELGSDLASEAHRNLVRYPNATIEIGEFENVAIDPSSYDLVMSATAFHWIRQPVGYRRVASVLTEGGYFAEFRHHHVWSPESEGFYNATQAIYSRYDPDAPVDKHRLPKPEAVETLEKEIAATGLFREVSVRRYRQDVVHTAESYSDLLWTFSDHIAQPEPKRTNLIEGIAQVIRDLPGGRATKSHLVLMHVAKRL